MSQFFGLEPDIRQILAQVELKGVLRYTPTDYSRFPQRSGLLGAATIPGLGIADGDQQIVCSTYLVTEQSTLVCSRRIDRTDGTTVYAVDQSLNPDSIMMTAGGRWKDGSIIAGRVASCSKSKVSERLMRRFRTALRKRFENIRRNWIGPEALKEMRKGVRLCHAIQSPPLYDLKEIITPEDERQFAEHEREILRRASAEPLQVLSVGELTAIFSADGKNERLN